MSGPWAQMIMYWDVDKYVRTNKSPTIHKAKQIANTIPEDTTQLLLS